MASLNFNNFRNIYKEERDYTYKDLHFDIEQEINLTADSRESPKGKDIKMSLDENAIKNSIINIFNTNPGERFLIPEFGINLKRYLFKSVTDDTARSIGETILAGLERWEPRIRIDNITVMARNVGRVVARDTGRFSDTMSRYLQMPAGEDEYIVNIAISIPILRHRTNLEGVLTQQGFRESTLL
jgi:phage baseplate assembly protein W